MDKITNLPTVHPHRSDQGFQMFANAFKVFPTIVPDDDDEEQEMMRMATNANDDEEEPRPMEPQTVLFMDEENKN